MELIKENEMKLLSRKRLTLMRENKGATPSRQDLIKEIAKQFNVKEELVIIKHVYSQFGENKTKVIAHIYSDKNKMKFFEHTNLLKKHEKKAEAPKEDAPGVEEKPVEEAPKEEPKPEAEEKPAEEN